MEHNIDHKYFEGVSIIYCQDSKTSYNFSKKKTFLIYIIRRQHFFRNRDFERYPAIFSYTWVSIINKLLKIEIGDAFHQTSTLF